MLGYLERYWKPSWAPWGPLGAILGHLGRSSDPRLPTRGPGGEIGRGVNPLPEGKEGVGRGRALNHLRPKVLVALLKRLSSLPTWRLAVALRFLDMVQGAGLVCWVQAVVAPWGLGVVVDFN